MIKACAICGKDFETWITTAKYCSDECRNEAKKIRWRKCWENHRDAYKTRARTYRRERYIKIGSRKITCVICGKEFDAKRANAKYCSDACRNKRQRKYYYAKRRARSPKLETTCAICGQKFVSSRRGVKYCSDKCRHTADIERKRQRREIRREVYQPPKKPTFFVYGFKPRLKICVRCGAEFMAKGSAVNCPDCLAKISAEKKRREFKRFGMEPEQPKPVFDFDARLRQALAKPPKQKTLADWAIEAKACNFDYGSYRTQIEQFGKTFDQLQAQSGNFTAHAHHGGFKETRPR